MRRSLTSSVKCYQEGECYRRGIGAGWKPALPGSRSQVSGLTLRDLRPGLALRDLRPGLALRDLRPSWLFGIGVQEGSLGLASRGLFGIGVQMARWD